MENICRICLRVSKDLIPLQSNPKLITKIQTISSIEFIDGDIFPRNICTECTTNVNKFYNFREVIINNDKELKERHEIRQLRKTTQNLEAENFEDEFIPHNVTVEIIKTEKNEQLELESDPINLDSTKIEEFLIINEPTIESPIPAKKSRFCTICNKLFSSRLKLSCHKRTEHNEKGICNICGMSIRKDNLKRHVKSHNEAPVACKICSKVMKNTESLRSHMLWHRDTTFICPICGKTSKVKSEHTRHIKIHQDPEAHKFACQLCGKKVVDLKRHMQSHTGERPHFCTYCNKGFTSPYALKVHTRQHTKERPYHCKYCPMAFPQKVSLVTHLKSKHQECNS